MQDTYCCNREMYQEIGADNILISICKVCGKSRKQRVNFGGKTVDNIEYFTVVQQDDIENLNTILKGKEKR